MKPVSINKKLIADLAPLEFSEPVTHVYNPLEYAGKAFSEYVERYARPSGQAVLLGMNPGPWGMAQTGVPFGEVNLVRDWMGITAKVGKPSPEHPKRPVEGFECKRSEVSGARLWGWARERFSSPERFFERFFVLNYCPLVFMEASGRNRTPDKLPTSEREPMVAACDVALGRWFDYLNPSWIIGVGMYAEKCAARVVGERDIPIGRILHPSPASPAANRGWAPQAEAGFKKLGIEI